MTAPILSFRAETKGHQVDLSNLVTSRLLLQANSGGGKSRMLRYILEQTHGRIQHIVIDPEGEFSSLRERFNYLLAGTEGDVPADPKTAKVLARRLLELNASAIIDIYELELRDRKLFVKNFLQELMHVPRQLWRPLLVVIDEAHEFAPEKGESDSTEAVISLCTKGRKRGFSALLATQRLSKLHKDAAAELLNKLIGRTGLDVDLKRAGDELGFDKDTRLSLRDLDPGHFYAFGPAISKQVIEVRSGPITTTHPEPGQIAPPAPPAPAAVKKLVSQLHDLAEQSKKEAVTLEEKEARIRELERELRAARKDVPDVTIQSETIHRAVAAAEKPLRERITYLENFIERSQRDLKREVESFNGELVKISSSVREGIIRAASSLENLPVFAVAFESPKGGPPIIASTPHVDPAKEERALRTEERLGFRAAAKPATTQKSSREQQVLDTLAWYESVGIDNPTYNQVAGAIGVSVKKSTWRGIMAPLRAQQLIEEGSGRMWMSAAGRARAHIPESPPTLADLHATILGKLSGSACAVLEHLITNYPDSFTRNTVAEVAGTDAKLSTFRGIMAELRKDDLVHEPSKDEIRAADWLFPEGLE